MKHAGPEALSAIPELLAGIRAIEGLNEVGPGRFYFKSKALVHFHEDPSGMYADVKVGEGFERFRATTPAEQADLLKLIVEQCAARSSRNP